MTSEGGSSSQEPEEIIINYDVFVTGRYNDHS